MNDKLATLKNIIEAPKWAKLPSALRDIAFMYDVDLEISVDSGWIMETVRFKFSGTNKKIKAINKTLNKSLEEYNKGIEKDDN